MKPISNQPRQGPPIALYRGSPFALQLRFPEPYAIPTLTAQIRRNETLLTEALQPSVLAAGQVRSILIGAEQCAGLPTSATLVVYLAGVAKLVFAVSVATTGTPTPGGTTLALALDETLSIQVLLDDIDRVVLGQQAAATAIEARDETLEARDEALNAVGNIAVFVGEAPDGLWVDLSVGGNITVVPGTEPSPYPYEEFTFIS